MENFANDEVFIPNTYTGILEFINENRTLIANDFRLIFRIFAILDKLLKNAKNMSDLHRDTRIVLETIKLQLDSFVKEFKNEMSLSKMLIMADTEQLDDFFEYVKTNSLAMQFVDRLDFSYKPRNYGVSSSSRSSNKANAIEIVPDKFEANDDHKESDFEIQNIKTRVIKENYVEVFNLIFDSESFSKTIKNAFNLALALRMKQVSLSTNSDSLIVVPYDGTKTELEHSVFEITPSQYYKLKYKLTHK